MIHLLEVLIIQTRPRYRLQLRQQKLFVDLFWLETRDQSGAELEERWKR